MSYPKPLSEKSIAKLYEQSRLTQEQISFLRGFFDACANLYGAVSLGTAWGVYKKANENDRYPKLKRKDFTAFSSIARREEHSYYVYEIDELYSEEPRAELERWIVTKDLICAGWGGKTQFYMLMECLGAQPRYIPEDILSFKEKTRSQAEQKLLEFIGDLSSSSGVCRTGYGKEYPNENKGKKLKDFSFLTHSERFKRDEMIKNPKELAEFIKETGVSESEKVVNLYVQRIKIGDMDPGLPERFLMENIEEAGVELNEKKIGEIMSHLQECHNNTHLWCIKGWAPAELSKAYPRKGPVSLSLGADLQKMLYDGTINADELLEGLKKMGIKVD